MLSVRLRLSYFVCFLALLGNSFTLVKIYWLSSFCGVFDTVFSYFYSMIKNTFRLTTDWTVRYRISVGTRFSARPDRAWGPPSFLYNGYRVFPGDRGGRGVGLIPHPHLVPEVPETSTAIPLLTLRSCVAYKKRAKTYLKNTYFKIFFLNIILCGEIIAVLRSKQNTQMHRGQIAEFLNVKAGGT